VSELNRYNESSIHSFIIILGTPLSTNFQQVGRGFRFSVFRFFELVLVSLPGFVAVAFLLSKSGLVFFFLSDFIQPMTFSFLSSFQNQKLDELSSQGQGDLPSQGQGDLPSQGQGELVFLVLPIQFAAQ
jgi:hypothetical protein